MTVHVRIESVFEVAVGKLLLDNLEDLDLVNVNRNLQNAFGLEENNNPHDVHIADLDKRAGIIIKGVASAVTEIVELLRSKVPDTITFSHEIQQDAIYLGTVSR